MQQSTFGAATSIPACRTARSARYCRVLWQLFKPPDGAGPQFVREAYEAMIAIREVQPTFCKHPATILGGITNSPSTTTSIWIITCAAQRCPRPDGCANCSN